MWIRIRFDIAWRDIAAAAVYCILPFKRHKAKAEAEKAWCDHDDCIVTLSVRSAFDLMLRALKLPQGSEVLFTALTVPDMVGIARSHGLVPVPVDIDAQGHVCLDSLCQAISPKTRLFVVAHLFGGHAPLDDVFAILKPQSILLVEDCAQSFEQVGEQEHPQSAAVMHSFGPIKTATALGGAVVRVASLPLRNCMEIILHEDPIQSRVSYTKRLVRFSVLKAFSGQRMSAVFCRVAKWLGYDVDSLLNSLGRGFDADKFHAQIRQQPSTPLLRLMHRRWKTYDTKRIQRRQMLGKNLDEQIGLQHAASHTYWVYPLFIPNAKTVCQHLRTASFDATCRSRMLVVPAGNGKAQPTTAQNLWQQVVFMPWYPEITEEVVEAMAEIISQQR